MDFKLYDYQSDAVNRLQNGCILCGGVGSGKSLTSLVYYYQKVCREVKGLYDLYIITTARKRDTHEWEDECSKLDIQATAIDSWNNIRKYIDVSNAFFIFDEQRVVGSGAWVKAFLKIAKKNHWILLSATPGDTWLDYVPVFIANGFYKNKTEFASRHVVYSRYSKYPKVDKYIDQGRLIYFRNKILVDMDYKRPTVSHYEDIIVNYDKAMYKTVVASRWNPFESKPVESVGELGYLTRKVLNSDPTRIQAVLELCDSHPKVIIFYNYNYELDILRHMNYEPGTVIAEWNGFKHESIPNSKRWVYLVHYTAGAEGWNCVQTDTMIFYSLNYSYKIMTQAAGRIDRMNTKFKDLYYYRIRSAAPMDIAISRALNRKKKFNESGFFAS